MITGEDIALWKLAQRKAKSKDWHNGAAGTTELSSAYWPSEGSCRRASGDAAQLRTAYVRLTTPADGRGAGKVRWEPVGVICGACGAFWRKPPAE